MEERKLTKSEAEVLSRFIKDQACMRRQFEQINRDCLHRTGQDNIAALAKIEYHNTRIREAKVKLAANGYRSAPDGTYRYKPN